MGDTPILGNLHMYIDIPVVSARGGAEVALGIYKTCLIYRTCMRRAPAKPVRACILRKLCPVSHVTFEAPLRTSHFSQHSSHSTLHTSHSTLRTSHCTLRTPHFTSHCALKTPHFTLHTSQSTLHTFHFSLHSSDSTLHTSHSTLHTALFTLHTSHCTLHTPHFTSSELFSPYPCSSLLISSLLICHLSFHESLPSTTSRTCMRCAPARPVRACFVRSCCSVVVQEHGLRATPVQMQRQASTFLTLHIALFTPHAQHFTLAIHLNSSHLSFSHLSSCLPIRQLSFSWLFSCHRSAAQPFSSHRS